MTVAKAHADLKAAEQKIRDAKQARDQARDQLDQALAGAGWKRLRGAFTADATPLYENRLYPDACLEVGDVLDVLERQAAV